MYFAPINAGLAEAIAVNPPRLQRNAWSIGNSYGRRSRPASPYL